MRLIAVSMNHLNSFNLAVIPTLCSTAPAAVGPKAMVDGRKLRPAVAFKKVTLPTLCQEVVVGLRGVSVMADESDTKLSRIDIDG